MISIDVRVQADEVIAVLSRKSQKLRTVLEDKMRDVMRLAESEFLEYGVGKYIDPSTVEWGIQGIGSQMVIGYLEARDKAGGYPIWAVNAKVLRFIAKSGDIVFTKRVFRPYLKTSKFLEQYLIEMKPWLEEQLREAIEDAI